MDGLPTEILHYLCNFIPQRDLGRLRLTSSKYREFPIEHMIRHIHVICYLQTWFRLRKIANMELRIRQHVRSITFECDLVPEYRTREEWERNIHDESSRGPKPQMPPPHCSPQEKIAYQDALANWTNQPRPQYSQEFLDRAWLRYRYVKQQQEMFQTRSYFDYIQILYQLTSEFPLLQSCRAYWDHEQGQSEMWHRHFDQAMCRPDRNRRNVDPGDMLKVFLAGVANSQTQLRSLSLTQFDWGNLIWDGRDFPAPAYATGRAVEHLHYLCLAPLTEAVPAVNDRDPQRHVADCNMYLRGGTLRLILQAARNLRDLRLQFRGYTDRLNPRDLGRPCYPARFTDLFGLDTTWDYIINLELHQIETRQEEFLDFLRRHVRPLRSLHLKSLCLNYGTWPALFAEMRNGVGLNLSEISLGGVFTSFEDYREWNLESDDLWDTEAPRRKRRLQHWVLGWEPEREAGDETVASWENLFNWEEGKSIVQDEVTGFD